MKKLIIILIVIAICWALLFKYKLIVKERELQYRKRYWKEQACLFVQDYFRKEVGRNNIVSESVCTDQDVKEIIGSGNLIVQGHYRLRTQKMFEYEVRIKKNHNRQFFSIDKILGYEEVKR